MKRLSNDEVLDARQALAEHAEQNRPKHTDTSAVGDWTKSVNGSCLPTFDLKAKLTAAHALLAAENAKRQNH